MKRSTRLPGRGLCCKCLVNYGTSKCKRKFSDCTSFFCPGCWGDCNGKCLKCCQEVLKPEVEAAKLRKAEEHAERTQRETKEAEVASARKAEEEAEAARLRKAEEHAERTQRETKEAEVERVVSEANELIKRVAAQRKCIERLAMEEAERTLREVDAEARQCETASVEEARLVVVNVEDAAGKVDNFISQRAFDSNFDGHSHESVLHDVDNPGDCCDKFNCMQGSHHSHDHEHSHIANPLVSETPVNIGICYTDENEYGVAKVFLNHSKFKYYYI